MCPVPCSPFTATAPSHVSPPTISPLPNPNPYRLSMIWTLCRADCGMWSVLRLLLHCHHPKPILQPPPAPPFSPRPASPMAHEKRACTGALARGDAKVLLMGGQDNIWDHAAGMLIAQESGLKVTNGAGVPLHDCLCNLSDIKCLQSSVCESDLLNPRQKPPPFRCASIGAQRMMHACRPVQQVNGLLLCPQSGGLRGVRRSVAIALRLHTS